ncbi:alpha/beta hydrolase [Candidatus Omnitrophota bacterium]
MESKERKGMRERIRGVAVIVFVSLVFCCCCLLESSAGTRSNLDGKTVRWVTPAVRVSQLHHRLFYSESAKADVSYHIYIPEIYHSEPQRRFPVIYWLHGHGGGLPGLSHLVKYFDAAIRKGNMPPVLIVFPNGMKESMWCNSKDGKIPIESVMINDLLPHVDKTWRTISSREGRLIEGFSMGGYGAARLSFKYPYMFSGVSILGGGPLQQEFTEFIGPRKSAKARKRVMRIVYGDDQAYFKSQSPYVLAAQNADVLRDSIRVRLLIGAQDDVLKYNREFDAHLTSLNISHVFRVLSDVDHDTMKLLHALGESNWKFYREMFGAFDL